jgi:hypothetical protein
LSLGAGLSSLLSLYFFFADSAENRH